MSVLERNYGRLSLAVKYETVLFPFDVAQFLRALPRQGFFLPESLEEATLAIPIRARIEPSGIVAKKGEITVRLDVDRRVLGVLSLDPEATLTEMESLESLLRDELGFDSPTVAQYYEFLGSVSIHAQRSPLESWTAHLAQVPVVEQASKLIGTEVSPFGLRLAPAGGVPNQLDWFDIRIEPRVQAPTEYHYADMVFRHPARDRVFAFVGNLDHLLEELVSLVEGA